MSEVYTINSFELELAALGLELGSPSLTRDNFLALLDRTFGNYTRQVEKDILASLNRAARSRPGGAAGRWTFVVGPCHQPKNEGRRYGATELGSESTNSEYISDNSLEDAGYDDSEIHKTVNIGPWVASILNPDPRQPTRSAESLFMLQNTDTSSQVIEIPGCMVASVTEIIRQLEDLMRVCAWRKQKYVDAYSSAQRDSAFHSWVLRCGVVYKKVTEMERTYLDRRYESATALGASWDFFESRAESVTALLERFDNRAHQILSVMEQIVDPSRPGKRKSGARPE
ncbi:unnamed protein product [Rhizoctonia solani]|uniref:Uncharacterized protein n=1 Tax=Rhizoctonia solani TaxID=456999 RepID=A0A8H2X2V3_9AGAM|nr:unnamed protein product [Rhizoctonia solani]